MTTPAGNGLEQQTGDGNSGLLPFIFLSLSFSHLLVFANYLKPLFPFNQPVNKDNCLVILCQLIPSLSSIEPLCY